MYRFITDHSLIYTTLSILLLLTVAVMSFALLEPRLVVAQESVDITVTQTITGQTSFTTDPANVVMDSSIASITGGTSNGTSSFTVQSNSATGYNVTIAFAADPAMQLNGGGGSIPDYIEDTPGTPDYGFGNESAGGSAQFGFSVYGASAGIVSSTFQDNGTNSCGGGGSNQYGQCWSAASTSAVTILNSSSATSGGGDTSNVLFRVHVPSNPSPAVPAGTYTATATLTVSENP